MPLSDDSSDSGIYQQNLVEEPPSGYLLQKVLSTMITYFSIVEKGVFTQESKNKIPPIMRDCNSPQNWKSWNAVNPPDKQNYSNKVIGATLNAAKRLLVFPESSITDMLSKLQVTLSPKMIAVDWTLYLYLLEHDGTGVTKDDFEKDEYYIEWKNKELGIVKRLLNNEYVEDDPKMSQNITNGYSIATLTLQGARGIHKKAEMSTIFSVIHFQDLYTVSNTVNALDLNPEFNHSLSFLLRENSSNDERTVIVVSIWCKKPGARGEHFLGFVKLTVKDLVNAADDLPRYYELQRRSTRSNVSGEVCISVKRVNIHAPKENLYADIMTCIPFCYEACLRDLIEVCHLKSTNASSPLEQIYAAELIEIIATAWNAPYYMTTVISIETLAMLYIRKKISLEVLKKNALDRSIEFLQPGGSKISVSAKKTILKTIEKIHEHLKDRLVECLGSEINEDFSTNFLEIVDTLSVTLSICTKDKSNIEDIINMSFEKYIEHMSVLAFKENIGTYNKLNNYAKGLKTILSSFIFHLNKPLHGTINLPDILSKKIAAALEVTLNKVAPNVTEDTGATFMAYNTIKDLIATCKLANEDSVRELSLRKYFYEGVIAWLDNADKDISNWVIKCMEMDTMQPISSTLYHTTSVIDTCSCFSVHMKFIKGLDWENKEDEQLFNERLYASLIKATDLYINNTLNLLQKELDEPETKLIVRTLKEFEKDMSEDGSKISTPAAGVPTKDNIKVNSTMCAMINNICVLPSKIEDLLESNKTIVKFNSNLTILPRQTDSSILSTLSLRAQRLIKNSFIPIMITIETLQTAILKFPTSMPLFIRLSYNGNVIATTKPLIPSKSAEYNEIVWLNLSNGIESDKTTIGASKGMSVLSQMDLEVVKILYENGTLNQEEEVVSAATVDIDWALAERSNIIVPMPNCGRVTLKLTPIPHTQYLAVFPVIVSWLANRALNKVGSLLADTIAKEYLVRTKKVSKKFKSLSKGYFNKMINTIDALDKTKRSTSTLLNPLVSTCEINDELIERELSPVLSFLNVNLERIVSECPLQIAVKIVSEIWNRVLFATEGLIVPFDVESRKEKTAWSRDRIKFIQGALNVLYLFFDCGGEGLTKEELETERYYELCLILDYYFHSRKELQAKLNEIIEQEETDVKSTSQKFTGYWVIQIMKAHGEIERVYSYLRNRTSACKLQYDVQVNNVSEVEVSTAGTACVPEAVVNEMNA